MQTHADPAGNRRGNSSPTVPGEDIGERFDRGIAFVHGIGEQKCGESLTAFAEAMGLWLQQWLTAMPETDLRVTRAELEPPTPAVGAALSDSAITDSSDAQGPARTVLTICRRGMEDERVLLVECWWADSFEPPKLRELLSWLTLIAPNIVMAQTAAPLRRSWRRLHLARGKLKIAFLVIRMLVQSLFFLSSVVLVPLFVALLAMILLPAVIPISAIREAARRAATLAVSYLGDAFILTASPIRRDIMTSAVQADLEWLSRRCKEISIVAHSQGAVLAHDALRRGPMQDLRHLITIGAGLEKLLKLRLLFRKDRGVLRRQWMGMVAGVTLLVCTVAAPSALAAGHEREGLGLILAALFSAVVLALGMALAFSKVDDEAYEQLLRLEGAGTTFEWLDLYASSDPVPNGPLIDKARSWMKEREVFNYASIVRDHTSYLHNRDDVLPRLAYTVLGKLPHTRRDVRAIRYARTRRRMRTRLLATGRTIMAAAGAAITIALWSELDSFGSSIRSHLPGVAVRLLRHIFNGLPGWLNSRQGRGVVAWLVAWALAYCLFALLLSLWGRLDQRLMIEREPADGENGFLRALAATVACLTVITTAVFALVAGFLHRWSFGLTITGIVLAGALAVAAPLALGKGPEWLEALEKRLAYRWLKQEHEESYQRLRDRARAGLTRMSGSPLVPGWHGRS